MKLEEEVESAPRTSGAARTTKDKKKTKTHIHIGPYAKAYRTGAAFCPVCDSEKICRMTESEKLLAQAAKEAQRVRH